MAKVVLTKAQADTLLALRGASARFTDTTCEIAGWDNSGYGTGRRLKALAAKGLCTRNPMHEQVDLSGTYEVDDAAKAAA